MKKVCSAILLAAGRSSRMGTAKGLLPWRGTTLFEYQIIQLLRSRVSDVVVVLGHEPERYKRLASDYDVKVVVNESFEQGKTSSILCGLLAINRAAEFIVIVAVDQPISAQLINELITSMQKNDSMITIPTYEGKRGHPVLFSKFMLQKLYGINEETSGLRQVLQECADCVTEAAVADPTVLINFNTPEDYRKYETSEGRNGFENFTNRTGFS